MVPLMARVAGLCAGLALVLPAAAQEPSRHISALWWVQAAEPPQGERELASGEFVLKQRLLPTGLVELEAPVAIGSATLAAGTQLVDVNAGDGPEIFCIPEVAKQKLIGASFQPCLMDSDSDGDFEGWFNVISQTKGLLTLTGKYPKKPKPLAATRYRIVPPQAMTDEYFVAIERRNYFNIYSRESFMIAFGRDGALERLTAPISFKSDEMPKQMTVMGASFTALSERDGKLVVSVTTAMPRQIFSVIKTTSYSFY